MLCPTATPLTVSSPSTTTLNSSRAAIKPPSAWAISLGKVVGKQQWQCYLCQRILYIYQGKETHLQKHNKQLLKACGKYRAVFCNTSKRQSHIKTVLAKDSFALFVINLAMISILILFTCVHTEQIYKCKSLGCLRLLRHLNGNT